MAPVLGVVGEVQGEALLVAPGDPHRLDARKRRDLEVDLPGGVPGEPAQRVHAGRLFRGGLRVGLFHGDAGERAVETLTRAGQAVDEEIGECHGRNATTARSNPDCGRRSPTIGHKKGHTPHFEESSDDLGARQQPRAESKALTIRLTPNNAPRILGV